MSLHSEYQRRLPNPKSTAEGTHWIPKVSSKCNKNPLRFIKRSFNPRNQGLPLPQQISSNYNIYLVAKESQNGRFGSSFKVVSKENRRSYLLKTMDKANCSEAELRNIYHTLDVLSKVKDDNIAWIHHYSTIDNQIYIFFEPLNEIQVQKGESKSNFHLFMNICKATEFMQDHNLTDYCANAGNFCNRENDGVPKLVCFSHCNSQYCDSCNNAERSFSVRQLGVILCELLGGKISVFVIVTSIEWKNYW
jgi:hypothetical protein